MVRPSVFYECGHAFIMWLHLPGLTRYDSVFVTDCSAWFGCAHSPLVTVRGLHFGKPDAQPESLLRMDRDDEASPWRVVAHELLKDYAAYTVLALGWLDRGRWATGARACLIGLAAGSLVHLWRECVPGGEGLQVDGVEIDAAVLEASRGYLGLAVRH